MRSSILRSVLQERWSGEPVDGGRPGHLRGRGQGPQPNAAQSRNIDLYRLLMKNVDFYFPLFYYCLVTSAGGNFTHLSHMHGKIKLNHHPLNINIFVDFSLKICGFFYKRLIGIPKDNKIVYNNFFGK